MLTRTERISSEQGVVGIEMLYKSVGSQHDKEADRALEKTDRAGLREVKAVHHGAVYVRLNDVRSGEQHGIVADEVVEQAEVALQNAADSEQEQHDDRRLQRWQDDIANLLETVRAVDLRRLEHGSIHAGYSGEVHYRAVARPFPDVHQDDDQRPCARILVDFRHFAAHGAYQIGNEAEVIVLGDVNCDGNVSVTDARLALRQAVGLEEMSGARLAAAQLTDGKSAVSVGDARLILRAAVTLDDPKSWLLNMK